MGFVARVARTKPNLGGHRGGRAESDQLPSTHQGVTGLGLGGVMVDGLRGLLILLSLPERSLSGLGVKKGWGWLDKR